MLTILKLLKMNLHYEELFTAFIEKANIKRDPCQIAQTLKEAYPNCNLPVSKTIKRCFNGETAHPRETLLGFLSAYILDKTEAEVLEADRKNKLGDFYKIFSEPHEKMIIEKNIPPSVIEPKSKNVFSTSNDRLKTLVIWALCLVVVSLIFYILLSSKRLVLPPNIQFPTMIPLKSGVFTMGDTFNDTDSTANEKPCHQVILDSFEMSQTPIMFDLFDKFCIAKNIPLREDLGWGRKNHPAIMMDWYEAVAFCNWLSELNNLEAVYTIDHNKVNGAIKVMSHLEKNGYRLPTEAEWEYAASIDVKTNIKYRFGNHKNRADGKELNFDSKGNAQNEYTIKGKVFHHQTLPVLESGINQNNLYGMAGNVAEWCHDYYHPRFYKENNNNNNPVAEECLKDTSCLHVLRGGTWKQSASKIRASFRGSSSASSRSEMIGFRVVRRQRQEVKKIAFLNNPISQN